MKGEIEDYSVDSIRKVMKKFDFKEVDKSKVKYIIRRIIEKGREQPSIRIRKSKKIHQLMTLTIDNTMSSQVWTEYMKLLYARKGALIPDESFPTTAYF